MTNFIKRLRQMIRSRRHLGQSLAILTAAAVLVATAGCARGEMSAANDSETGAQANVRVTNVEATPVVPGEFRGVIRVTGEVEALYDVTVSAEESGRIEQFLVAKGRRVRSGQAIAKLESDLLSAQVNEARASARLASEEYERQRQGEGLLLDEQKRAQERLQEITDKFIAEAGQAAEAKEAELLEI